MNKKWLLISGLMIASLPSFAYKTKPLMQGVALYQAACSVCHAPEKAKAIKAPAAFDALAWQQRFKQAKKEAKDNFKFKTAADYFLYQIHIGKGLMHHGGLCNESKAAHPNLDCSDASYLQAIEYMSHQRVKDIL